MSAFVSLRPLSARRTEVSGSVLGAQSSAVAPHGQSNRSPVRSGTAGMGWTASQKGQWVVTERHWFWAKNRDGNTVLRDNHDNLAICQFVLLSCKCQQHLT